MRTAGALGTEFCTPPLGVRELTSRATARKRFLCNPSEPSPNSTQDLREEISETREGTGDVGAVGGVVFVALSGPSAWAALGGITSRWRWHLLPGCGVAGGLVGKLARSQALGLPVSRSKNVTGGSSQMTL